jgi:4-amino-4-deoxy-L-arabinose transferase-like glycosyltransferase
MKNQVSFPFKLFTGAVLLLLIVPVLIKDGMFADGVLYAAVAHNEAHGFGSFWFPQYSHTVFLPFFHQQPPLTFGIQALFFKIFGDSMYVERFYSLLCACLSAGLIAGIWKQVYTDKPASANLSWFPVLLWIITPVCFYSYSNNLEENTLGVFALLGLWFIIKGINRNSLWYIPAAAVSLVLAVLCKGFPGLYPLAFPFLHWMVFRNGSFSKTVSQTFLLLASVVALLGLLMLNPNAAASLSAYLHDRVLNSILNVNTGQGRFHLVVQLCADLGVPLSILLLTLLISRLSGYRTLLTSGKNRKMTLLFILLGMCASFPLMITREQRWFYTVPSIPAFAIGLSAWGSNGLARLMEKCSVQVRKLLLIISIACLAGTIAYSASQAGKVRPSQETDILDSRLIGKALPAGTTLNTYPYTFNNWALQQYLSRYYYLNVTQETPVYGYFLTDRTQHQVLDSTYTKLDLPTIKYDVYRKNIK